jgi:oxygen-independent coproporphyrinogen III oxidase
VNGNIISEVSLYFHIPFCTKKCPYCHFYVLPDKSELKRQFLQALELEWLSHLPKLKDKKIVSIYFGGGTPSLMEPSAIGSILDWLRSNEIQCVSGCEITLEANPENVHVKLIEDFAGAGINRVSIGVQSLDDSLLNTLERRHGAKGAIAAIENCYSAGVRNISIDLMYDLPGQTISSWQKTLAQAAQLPLTHLSLYNLTIEPHTVFFKRKNSLIPLLPTPETSLEMLELAVATLEASGLKRYEVSAFAKEGLRSRHNTGYWTGRPFLGLGPSAFSYWEKKRFRNICNLSRYAKALSQGLPPVDFEEELPWPANLRELLAVNLRLLDGVDLSSFESRHGALTPEMRNDLAGLQEQGLVEYDAQRVKLTQKGLLFYDSVAETLI